MTEKKKEVHVHKFRRLRYKNGSEIFFCALPSCEKKISIPLALGKESLCWRCGQPFIMTEYSLRLAKPHCDLCHKPKKTDDDDGNERGKVIFVPEPGNPPLSVVPPLSLAEQLAQTIKGAQRMTISELDDEI